MTWLQRYRLAYYVHNSLWIAPLLGALAAVASGRLLHLVEQELGWTSTLDADTARTVLTTLASSMFTFIVFVSSALLVAVQLASGQLTPRIIAFVFKDPVTKCSLTFFVFSFTFALAALIGIKTEVPMISARVAACSSLASLGLFLYMIDHAGKGLRPSGALWGIGKFGRQVVENVYPRPSATSAKRAERPPSACGEPSSTVASPKDGVLLAFDTRGLVALARRADCLVELVPQVGDFLALGDPLFRIFGGTAAPCAAALCQSVAVGQERTLQQDPTFAFRIIVDIASKGLSPAINDPTTAVLAIDQIHHLLRNVGTRQLDDGQVPDVDGKIRLIYRTPDWDDFVYLAVTEIRQFGGASIQVARRLRAMLENLIQVLPEDRSSILRLELSLLQRSAERFFVEPEDRALADVSDFQGVGGKYGEPSADATARLARNRSHRWPLS